MAQIKMKIKTNGVVEMETEGFNGRDCIEKSQAYKDALGIEDNSKQSLTSEAYSAEVQNEESL